MAKEKFENRRLSGKLNIKCKYDDGTTRIWIADKSVVVEQIKDIVDYYQSLDYKLTLRQLHYQFVSRNWIVNHDTAYKKLGKILDDCRYGGVIDWDAIEDRGRVPYLPYYVHDIPDALKDTIEAYRLDRQRNQDIHIEVWTEKDALSGIMKRTTEKYGVKLVVNKGYTSSSAIYRAYKRFLLKKRVIILYFGDHDPSGLDMVRDIDDRLNFMFDNGSTGIVPHFKIIPIGLTMAQIRKYKCPENPAKLTDARAGAYIQKFGRVCWEVDALNPEILTDIVEHNIRQHMNLLVYEDILAQEEKDIKKLRKIIDKHK